MVCCSPCSPLPGYEQLGPLVVLWGHKCCYPSISLIAMMCLEYMFFSVWESGLVTHLFVSVTSAFVCNVLFLELLLCVNLSVVADACLSQLLCPATL